jgi:hypothetical protein
MKCQFNRAKSPGELILYCILLICVCAFPVITRAQAGQPNPGSVVVYYESTHYNQYEINIQYNNVEGASFKILLSDNKGFIFYSGIFFDITFNKNIILPKSDSIQYFLQIKTQQTHKWQSFVINTLVKEKEIVNRKDH